MSDSLIALTLVSILVGLVCAGRYVHAVIRLAVAHKAKLLCSGVFVAGRTPREVCATDLALDNHRCFQWIPAHIDRVSGRVRAGWPWYVTKVAIYRPGIGATLIHSSEPGSRSIVPPSSANLATVRPALRPEWRVSRGPSAGRLASVLERAFAEPPDSPPRRTRAVVVVHRGRIAAERYAPGFGAETPMAGWSLAKLVVNALIGIMVRQGKLALSDPAPVPAWSRAGDPRRAITIEHLLRMTSGLRFGETYRDPREDILQMLLAEPDCAGFAAGKPLDHSPGSRWQYSGGSTNILCGILRSVLGEESYAEFPRRALFDRLGMSSAVLEVDASGNFVGSSFMYASARDWARLGLLYANDGRWQGRRILPAGWVDFCRRATPESPQGEFGAHCWLRISSFYQSPEGPVSLPGDAFHGIGYEGQFITVIPSERLVVVRLGLTRRSNAWAHDRFVDEVITAVRAGPSSSPEPPRSPV